MKTHRSHQAVRSKRGLVGGAWSIAGSMLLAMACGGAAHAAVVTNGGFETGDLTGWTLASSGGYGSGASVTDNVADQTTQYPTFDAPLPGTAEGTHYAQVAGNSGSFSWLYQDVGALQANTTYSLTVAVGDGKYDFLMTSGLIALVNGTNQTGTMLASADPATLGFGAYAGTFKDLTANFTTGTSVSGDLVVAIGGDGFPNPSFKFDNVRLTAETAAVPEPMSLALLGVGALGLTLRRRR